MKRFEDALNYYLTSLDLKRMTLGDKHQSTGITFYNIGTVY